MITQTVLHQEYSNYFDFEIRGDLCIVKVKLLRASSKISVKFKEFSTNLVYGGRKKIIVDITKSDFMDSSFLGSIVHLARIAKNNGGDIKVVMQNHIQQHISKITRLDRVFQIYQDLDLAIKEFNGPRIE